MESIKIPWKKLQDPVLLVQRFTSVSPVTVITNKPKTQWHKVTVFSYSQILWVRNPDRAQHSLMMISSGLGPQIQTLESLNSLGAGITW